MAGQQESFAQRDLESNALLNIIIFTINNICRRPDVGVLGAILANRTSCQKILKLYDVPLRIAHNLALSKRPGFLFTGST